MWTAESQETYAVAALATVSGGESGRKNDGRAVAPRGAGQFRESGDVRVRAARVMNDASARGRPGIGPALGIAGHTLRAGHQGVDFCEAFGGQ